MKTLLISALLLTSVFSAPEDSLVRVNSTIQKFSASQPWEKTPPVSRRGLGTLLEGTRILTTAAMAADSIYLELQSADGTRDVPAKVVAIDYEANLALLEPVGNPGFLTELAPAELSAPSKPGDSLQIFQLETNGDPLATAGTIRSMELLSTFIDGRFFLGYIVKASLQTSGNSFTLPAYRGNKLAGIVTSYDAKDQISNVISVDILKAFLNDAKDGDYAGFPSLGIAVTTTEDPHFRGWLKLPEESGGLYITRVVPGGSAEAAGIRKGDVILKINDLPIDRRGYFKHPSYGTLFWPHLVRGEPAMGEQITLELLREGELETVTATLKKAPDPLVPGYSHDQAPPFLIKGGLVFQELSRPYLEAFGKNWTARAPLNLLDVLSNPADYEKGRDRVVVLTRVIATEATIGYDRLNNQIVESANGKPVANLTELAAALEKAPDSGIHRLKTDDAPFEIFLDEELSGQVDTQFLQRGLPVLKRLPGQP